MMMVAKTCDVKVEITANEAVQITEDSFNFLEQSGRKLYWNQGYKGRGVVVAVVDSGVDRFHPELIGQVLNGRNFCPIDSPSTTDTSDYYGHGTHVAATIAGKLKCGIAPESKILPVKVLDSNGILWMEQWLIDALNYIYQWRGINGERVDIVNMSLGGFGFKGDKLDKLRGAVQKLNSIGISVVTSAGNNGRETSGYYPAALEEVICVGAVDIEKKRAYFSNVGEMVDLCQIGVNVLSAKASTQDYIYMSGTSMSTPIVSGILALMISKDKAINARYNAKLTGEQIELNRYMQLMNSTIDIGIKGTDTEYGTGYCTLNQRLVTEVKMAIGDNTYYINGTPVKKDVAPFYSEKRTCVPIRHVAELMGATIQYNGDHDIRVVI